jgi:fluoride exporter
LADGWPVPGRRDRVASVLPVRDHHELPVDPDAAEPAGGRGVLPAVALGGALGAAARWGISEVVPAAGGFPWPTLLANTSGALLLGVLLVLVVDVWETHHLVRPFLGIGLLGGYTTFSTYALETRDLLALGEYAVAATYLLGSVAAGLLAVWVGIAATRRLVEVVVAS